MVASPGEEEDYLKGIQDVIGRVPFFGGSAADNTVEGKWSIFADDKVFSDGVAVAFFYTNKKMANVYTGAYHESENVGIITKIKGKRTLVEIDGVPALKKYATWTGKKIKDLEGGNLLVQTITAPLGVKDRLGDLVAIRHPMQGNPDYSMNIGNNLAENTAVIQMKSSVDELISSTGDTMKELNKEMDGDIGAYLLVHCGGRRLGIGDRIDEVAKLLKKEELDSFRKDITIIDLASKPGGVDEEYAKEIGVKVIIALGIPGKEQPTTAAKYIKETIDKNFMC